MKRAREDDVDLYEAVLSDDGQGTTQEPVTHHKVLDIEAIAKAKRATDESGVIYISRIPPGMGPAKLKHLLSQYGETGKVYLARDPKDSRKQKKNAKRHTSYRFVEGWIEFMDKKIARSVADMLNAKPIGGKPSSPFHDDIWTLKYLPKFKWSMLSASIAQQAAIDAALLRNEISQSKKAQSAYLSQVDKERIKQKIQEKKAAAGKLQTEEVDHDDDSFAGDKTAKPSPSKRKLRAFEQRKTIKDSKASQTGHFSSKDLQNVLDNLF